MSSKQLNLFHCNLDIIKRIFTGENKLFYNFGDKFQR